MWRPFEDDNERKVAATRLANVHRAIRRRFRELERDLEAELATDAALDPDDPAKGFTDDVIEVEAEAVIRVLRLGPDQFKMESVDDWSGTRDKTQLEGKARLTDAEWAQLGVTAPEDADAGNAFTIDQTPEGAYQPDYCGYGYSV
jgi:hypothetical protein